MRRLTLAGLVSNLCKLVAGISVRTLDQQKLGTAIINMRRNRILKVGCAAYLLNGDQCQIFTFLLTEKDRHKVIVVQ